MPLHTKRWDDPRQEDDGHRLLVTRYRPRGLPKSDETWHASVFARQPWALCHIFGLTARGEPVHRLFGLKDGRLQARGFYLLPDFSFE